MASIEFVDGASKPSSAAMAARSRLMVGAGEGAGAEGGDVEAMAAAGEALAIAFEHFDVGEKVVAGGDWLTALEMGVAGHDGVGVFLGAVEEGGLEVGEEFGDRVDFGAAIEARVGGDLVRCGNGRCGAFRRRHQSSW